jgi:hypothetical protein
MAEEFVNGTDVLLYIDTTTPITTALNAVTTDNAELVACLTDNSFAGDTNTIESAGKCSSGFIESIASKIGWSMDLNSEHLKAAGLAGRLSGEELQQLWLDKTVFWAFQFDANQDSVVYGLGRIDSFSKSNGNDAIATFSATITGIGAVGTKATLAVGP